MERKDLVIIGSGGLAREARWLVDACNKDNDRWTVLGWVSHEEPGSMIDDLPVLGDDNWLINYNRPISAVIGIGKGSIRKTIAHKLKQNSLIEFPTIVAPTAMVSESVELGEGCVISFHSVLTVDIKIGSFFFCNLACTVGHDCRFSDYVTLLPGANVSGNVSLGECVTIGTGAAIIEGLKIGDNVFVGAGAAVISDMESDGTVVGVPARRLNR